MTNNKHDLNVEKLGNITDYYLSQLEKTYRKTFGNFDPKSLDKIALIFDCKNELEKTYEKMRDIMIKINKTYK